MRSHPEDKGGKGGGGGVKMYDQGLVGVNGDVIIHCPSLKAVKDVLEWSIIRGCVVDDDTHRIVINIFPPVLCITQGIINENKETQGARAGTLWYTASERLEGGGSALESDSVCAPRQEIG